MFLAGSEDGTVSKYSLTTNTYEGVLVRSSLPIRDVCISPNGQWAAVASEYVAASSGHCKSPNVDVYVNVYVVNWSSRWSISKI